MTDHGGGVVGDLHALAVRLTQPDVDGFAWESGMQPVAGLVMDAASASHWNANRCSLVPDLTHWPTIGALLGMLIRQRGGMWNRAYAQIEDALDRLSGRRPFADIMPGPDGLGWAVAVALLDAHLITWPPEEDD